MNALKPFVIFRDDGYYKNLDEFLNFINFPVKDTKICVYIKKGVLVETQHNIQLEECENLDDYQQLRKHVFSKADGEDILILFDTYYKFENPIDYSKLDKTTYIVLNSNKKDLGLPIIFSYSSEDNAPLDELCDINYYDTSDEVYTSVDVNTNLFNISLTSNCDDIVLFLVNFLFDLNIVDNEELPDISETDAQFYYTFLDLYNNADNSMDEKISDVKNILANFDDKYCTYLLINKLFTLEEIKMHSIHRVLFSNEPENCLLYYTGNVKTMIQEFIGMIDKIETKNFKTALPSWIEDKHFPDYIKDRDLPNITKAKNEMQEHKIVKDFKKYIVDNKVLEYKEDKFNLFNETFNNVIPIEHKKRVLYATLDSDNNYNIHALSNNKLTLVLSDKKSLEHPNIFGNMIKFFENNICLTLIRENCYAISVFTNKTFDFIGTSKFFTIDNPIGLQTENSNLFIITMKDGKYYKNEVDLVSYFTDICVFNDIDNVFSLKIKLRNNIKLSINNYNNIPDEFSGLRFNADEEVLANVKYDYINKIIDYNNNLYYHNKFVYLPQNINLQDKQYDVCYYKSYPILKELENKISELQISTGNDFRKAKYCFILQSELERLNSLELSEIIEHNTIIVSVLTPEQLASNSFIKKYTVEPLLQKLFLFNIGMNENYIEFVIEKILMDNQYDKRKEFMAIDKNNIFSNSNIFNIIHKIKNNNFSKKYPEKNTSLLNKFRKRVFKSDCSFDNLINYAIDKELELNIRYLNTTVPENIKKLNIFGTEKSMLEDCNTFDVLIVKTIGDLKNIEVSSENVFFFISDINKILIT